MVAVFVGSFVVVACVVGVVVVDGGVVAAVVAVVGPDFIVFQLCFSCSSRWRWLCWRWLCCCYS